MVIQMPQYLRTINLVRQLYREHSLSTTVVSHVQFHENQAICSSLPVILQEHASLAQSPSEREKNRHMCMEWGVRGPLADP